MKDETPAAKVTKEGLGARLAAIPGVSSLFREFFLSSPVPFQIYRPDGHSLVVNPAFLQLFGSEPPPEYCVFEDTVAVQHGYVEAMRSVFAGGPSVRLPTVWYNPRALTNVKVDVGEWVAIEAVVFPIESDAGRVEYVGFSFKDVTKEERFLTSLREAQSLLERAEDLSSTGSWSLDLDEQRRVRWSKNEHRIFGVKEGDFPGTAAAFQSYFYPADRDRSLEIFQRAERERKPCALEFRIVRPDGQVRWVSERAEIIPGGGSVPDRMVGVTRDITAERDNRDRAALSESRFRSLFNSAVFGYFVTGDEGRVAEANDAFLNMIGYDRDDLAAGRVSWRSITPREYDDVDRRAYAQLLASDHCSAYEKEYVRKDGVKIPVLVGGSWYDNTKREILAFALDLRDQRRLEQQFQQSQRLEAIGRLAGGVAHDFNNILGILLLYLEDLKAEKLDPELRRDRVESIGRQAQRAIRLTKQLLAFGRRQVRAPRALRLNDAIEGLREMLRRAVPENIQLEFALGDDLPAIRADLTQIEQVLLNLVSNARDAVGEDGRIRIETSALRLGFGELSRLRLAVPAAGSFVRLSVSDNGSGIDPRLLPHIYDPFFTTKELDKGTGLGLATVYGIVRQNGGDVRVQSALGQGTTFELYLPTDPEALASSEAPRSGRPATARGAGVVLLVEDQAELRRLMAEILSEQGFTVLEAKSGREALAAGAELRQPIRLVVADVIMPGMTGPAFVRALEQIKETSFPTLFVSGYPEAEITRQGLEIGQTPFLEKPFTRAAFLERVKSILG